MSYKQQLAEHYKQVRERLRRGVQPKETPKALTFAAQPLGGVSSPTGLAPPADVKFLAPQETVKLAKPPARLISLAEAKFLCMLPAAYYQRADAEADLSPKLPPLMIEDSGKNHKSLWRRLVAAVARNHGLEMADIIGPSRQRPVIAARFECMYRMRVELRMSYLSIAAKLKRDHTSVLHGVRVVRGRLLDEQHRTAQHGSARLTDMVSEGPTHTQNLAAV